MKLPGSGSPDGVVPDACPGPALFLVKLYSPPERGVVPWFGFHCVEWPPIVLELKPPDGTTPCEFALLRPTGVPIEPVAPN